MIDGNFVEQFFQGLGGATEFRLFFDRNNTLWIGTKEHGVKKIVNGNVESISIDNGLVNNEVTKIFEDSKGVIWIGTKRGLCRIIEGQHTEKHLSHELTDNYIRDFYEDTDDDIWIGTYGGGLLNYRNGVFTNISEKDGLAENIVSRILIDENDTLWILGNRGIYTVGRKMLRSFLDGSITRIYCTVFGVADGMEVSEGNGINLPAGWKSSDGKMWFPLIRGGVAIDPKANFLPKPFVYIEKAFLESEEIAFYNEVKIEPDGQNLQIDYTAVTFVKTEQVQFRYLLEGFD